MADGKVVIDIELEDGSVAKGIADVNSSIDGIGDASKKASVSIGKVASALGLVFLAKKGIDMVRDSLDGAIDRYDTLNQFPRVLQMLGFDAEATDAAIQKLSDGIDGLPTTLDSVASTAQNIAVMTGDLNGAVDTTLALNNAFLASGASSDDAKRGLEQYVQMLSKGEVDLQSWRTLQETMGVALNKLAEEFGFAGESAQNDLYDALKSGEVTFDEFNAKLIEASDAQGGFADMAKEASGGIKTSWTNVKTAVVKGVADVIEAIDKSLGGVGSIESILDNLKEGIKVVFTEIVKRVPAVIESIKTIYDTLEPWMPLIKGIVIAIGTFITAFAGIQTVIGIINKVRTAILLMNAALMANPVGLVVAAIIAAVALIYVYWEPIKDFFNNLWEGIVGFGLEIWEALKEEWSETVEFLTELWQGVSEFFIGLWEGVVESTTEAFESLKGFFSDLMESIIEVFSNAYEWLDNITNGAFGNYVDIIKSYLNMAFEIVSSIFNYIKDTIKNVLAFLKALVTGDFQGMKDAISNQMENVKNLISNIWGAIKNFVSSTLSNIKSVITNIFGSFGGIVSRSMGKVKDGVSKGIKGALDTVKNMATKFFDAGKNIVTSIADGIKNAAGKVTDAISGVAGKVRDFLPFSPAKEGPLKDIMKTNIAGSVAETIERGKGQVAKATSNMTGLISDEVNGDLLGELKGIDANIALATSIPDVQVSRQFISNVQRKNINPDEQIKILAGSVVMDKREVGKMIWEEVDNNKKRNENLARRFRGGAII